MAAPTDSVAGVTRGAPPLFVRQATGLVRELSTRDNILLNLAYVSFPLGFLWITVVPGTFAGADVGWGFILTSLLFVPNLIVYGMLASAMPRSGGDYLFISRAVHPLIGYITNSIVTLAVAVGLPLIGLFIPTFALPSLFNSLTLLTGNQRWTDLATSVSGKSGQVIIAGALIVVTGVLAMTNLRVFKRFCAILMLLAFVGVAFTVGAMLFIDQGHFVANFDRFTSAGAAARVTSAARDSNVATSGFSLSATLASILLLYTATAFSYVSAYWAGEVRRAKSTMVPTLVLTMGIGTLIFALVAFLAEHAFGKTFLAASQYVSGAHPDNWPLPASPFINLFISIGQPHVWLTVLLGVTFIAGVVALAAPTYILVTRNLFAHAFDRILPLRVSRVSDRTHAPIEATALTMVVMLAFLFAFVYLFASQIIIEVAIATLMNFILFFFVGVAAILFPYRQRELFEASPVRMRIAGVPLLSILGALDAAIVLAYIVVLMFTHWGTAIGSTNSTGLKGLAVTVAIFVLIWVAARIRSQRLGVGLEQLQRTLPPE